MSGPGYLGASACAACRAAAAPGPCGHSDLEFAGIVPPLRPVPPVHEAGVRHAARDSAACAGAATGKAGQMSGAVRA